MGSMQCDIKAIDLLEDRFHLWMQLEWRQKLSCIDRERDLCGDLSPLGQV